MALEEGRGKPLSVQTEQVRAFLEQRGPDGCTNRERIEQNQRVIRRVSTTDKTKSYEDAGPGQGCHDGVVVQDGKLIGFGIHIFNEDIYPLQSFEIYLRNCGLTGHLDLSGCGDLLFVDVYHNEIDSVDVGGDTSLQILGIQDNRISTLDVGELISCKGIDAGKNRLASLDVSRCHELVELYINDNGFTKIDLGGCPKLKYFYCHNNRIQELDTRANPLLRHLNATGNPLKRIRSLAPRREERLPLELTADGPGTVGMQFNPVYNAQWKETGEWRQTYYAYPQEGHGFLGWYDDAGALLSREAAWLDEYGASRVLTARFS